MNEMFTAFQDGETMLTHWKIHVYSLALAAFFLSAPGTAFSASPERIVSLAPSLTEIICDLGMCEKIVAVTDYCDYPPEVVKKQKAGGFSNPSLEMIVSLKPDLVFLTEEGNPKSVNDRLRKIGIKTYIFRARRIKELPRAVRDLGNALGVPQEAELKAQQLEAQLRRFEKRNRKFEEKPKKAAFIVQPVPLMLAGKETIMDDAFEILGIENIGAAGGKGYPKFSVEEFIRLEPYALFFGTGNKMEERAKPLLDKLKFLPAVRQERVFFLDEAVYRLGPRILNVLEEISNSIDR
jgi:iron complex transport system substrate-binding protein